MTMKAIKQMITIILANKEKRKEKHKNGKKVITKKSSKSAKIFRASKILQAFKLKMASLLIT